jgi:hypothetical protein
MALDAFLVVVAVVLVLVQLFLGWVVLEVVVHLLVTAHLLVQLLELQIQAVAAAVEQVIQW